MIRPSFFALSVKQRDIWLQCKSRYSAKLFGTKFNNSISEFLYWLLCWAMRQWTIVQVNQNLPSEVWDDIEKHCVSDRTETFYNTADQTRWVRYGMGLWAHNNCRGYTPPVLTISASFSSSSSFLGVISFSSWCCLSRFCSVLHLLSFQFLSGSFT